jgi:hypothetical protein
VTRREGVPRPRFETLHGRQTSKRRAPSSVPLSRLLRSPSHWRNRQAAGGSCAPGADGKPIAEGAPIDKQGAATDTLAAPRVGGHRARSVQSTLRLRDTPAPSRAPSLRFFNSLVGGQLRARLWPSRPRRFEHSRNSRKRAGWHQRCSKGGCPRSISRIAVKQTIDKRKQIVC